MVSIHSFANESLFSSLPNEYASSMNNTPPNALSITSYVLILVSPKNYPIKSDLLAIINLSLLSISPKNNPLSS